MIRKTILIKNNNRKNTNSIYILIVNFFTLKCIFYIIKLSFCYFKYFSNQNYAFSKILLYCNTMVMWFWHVTLTSFFVFNQTFNIFIYFIHFKKLLLILFYDIRLTYKLIFSQDYGSNLSLKKGFSFLLTYLKFNNIIKL